MAASTVPLRSIGGSLWWFWRRGRRAERAGYLVGTLLLVSGLLHLAALVIGGGSWEGPLSLRKAVTFGLSFGLTLITIVWVASFVRLGDRARAALMGAFTVACALETALVSLQAWRGVPSHFNMETPFDAMVARTLAAGGIALVVIIAALTFAAFRANPTVPISLRIAIQIGFVALSGAMVVGAFMIAKGMLLVFAGDPQAAYATGGTLKPTHAVTMHAILVLPALAWLLSFANWSEQRRLRVVLLAAAGYVAIAGLVAMSNVTGLELSQMPLALVALFALGALAMLVAGLVALSGVARTLAAGSIQLTAFAKATAVRRSFTRRRKPDTTYDRSGLKAGPYSARGIAGQPDSKGQPADLDADVTQPDK